MNRTSKRHTALPINRRFSRDLLLKLKHCSRKKPASVRENTGHRKHSGLDNMRPDARNTVVNRNRHAICVDASCPPSGIGHIEIEPRCPASH